VTTISYAVMREGNVIVDEHGNGIIVATSIWPTLAEAEFALTRTFSRQFGTWKARRSWIAEMNDVPADQLSNLQHNAPEYTDR
jgi:hypothetical protein